jgi:hypothetical protein
VEDAYFTGAMISRHAPGNSKGSAARHYCEPSPQSSAIAPYSLQLQIGVVLIIIFRRDLWLHCTESTEKSAALLLSSTHPKTPRTEWTKSSCVTTSKGVLHQITRMFERCSDFESWHEISHNND